MADADSLASEFGLAAPVAGARPTIVLNNPGNRTKADDLADEFGLMPTSDVPKPEEKKEFWQGLNADTSWSGFAKRLGVGTLRGMKDVIDTGAHGLQNVTTAVADKVLPEDMAAPIRQSVQESQTKDKTDRDKFDAEYPDGLSGTGAGRVAGQIAATIPVMPARAFKAVEGLVGAAPQIVNGVTKAAPMINRLGASVVNGIGGGSIFGGATASTNDKSTGENVLEGGISGAVGGPLVTAAGQGAKSLGTKAFGKISSTTADLAKRAEQLGIPLKATQVSNSPLLKKYDQISGMMPFSGAQHIAENQSAGFTKAVARTFGEDTAEITPKVVQNAKKRIGKDYDTVAANTTLNADRALAQEFAKTYQDAKDVLNPDHFKTFQKQLAHILDKFNNGQMTGEAWQAMRKTTEPMMRLINSRNNTELGQSVKSLKTSMDAVFNRSAPDDMQALLKRANSQYKAMKTIEKLAEADAEGHVSPLRLMGKVIDSPGGKLGSGELGEIADIGRQFFKQPADSGTPLGEFVMDKVAPTLHSPVSALITGGSAILSGASFGSIGEGAAALGANRLMRKAVNSKVIKDTIIRTAKGETHGNVNKLSSAVAPYAGAITDQRSNKSLMMKKLNE